MGDGLMNSGRGRRDVNPPGLQRKRRDVEENASEKGRKSKGSETTAGMRKSRHRDS